MDNRLLSDKDICEVCPANLMLTTKHIQLRCSVKTCIVHPDNKALAAAQLAKADKEWVEWLLENLFRETDYGLEWQTTPRIALKRLAERKQELGL